MFPPLPGAIQREWCPAPAFLTLIFYLDRFISYNLIFPAACWRVLHNSNKVQVALPGGVTYLANIFGGTVWSQFGQLDRDDNVYLQARYEF